MEEPTPDGMVDIVEMWDRNTPREGLSQQACEKGWKNRVTGQTFPQMHHAEREPPSVRRHSGA